jgi:hypothetical protein
MNDAGGAGKNAWEAQGLLLVLCGGTKPKCA